MISFGRVWPFCAGQPFFFFFFRLLTWNGIGWLSRINWERIGQNRRVRFLPYNTCAGCCLFCNLPQTNRTGNRAWAYLTIRWTERALSDLSCFFFSPSSAKVRRLRRLSTPRIYYRRGACPAAETAQEPQAHRSPSFLSLTVLSWTTNIGSRDYRLLIDTNFITVIEQKCSGLQIIFLLNPQFWVSLA